MNGNELAREDDSLQSANVGCANAVDAKALAAAARMHEREYKVANPGFRQMKLVRKGVESLARTVEANEVFQYVAEARLAGRAPDLNMQNLGLTGLHDLFSSSAKLAKSEKWGYWTPALYLASGIVAESGEDLCPFASDGCRLNCLLVSGQREMVVSTADQVAKQLKTNAQLSFPTNLSVLRTYGYRFDYKNFQEGLLGEMESEMKKANKLGLRFAVRLNATSDLPWENSGLMQRFPQVPFYDYTKIPRRALKFSQSKAPARFDNPKYKRKASNPPVSWKGGPWPDNYHLSFSYSEINLAWCLILLRHGVNVVVPFTPTLGNAPWEFAAKDSKRKNQPVLPSSFLGFPVIDGDAYDIRFIDNAYWSKRLNHAPPFIVGLRVKGNYQKRHASENGFFFDGRAAQTFGANPEFIAEHLVQNTKECIRQNVLGNLPPLDLAKEALNPKLFAAYESARRG